MIHDRASRLSKGPVKSGVPQGGARLEISPEVASALADRRPVVALETTLATHGFPPPEGLRIARELETTIETEGAVPATIGVLGGALRVGLSRAELLRLVESTAVRKLNPSNLAAGIASGEPGSTTVAATLLAAHRTGIDVLATGGIGGVHRGVVETGDVSADLTALGRYPVAVVCAGAKAVLDLSRTLEQLETLGVPVLGVGTGRFPAFYRRDSGLPVDRGFATLEDLAAAVQAHIDLGSGTGVLVANPIPREHEMPRELYEVSLERALDEWAASDIRGREVTPFLLTRLGELTDGRSSFSNRALLIHNARLAARLAVVLRESG